jgi:hypothetical protein
VARQHLRQTNLRIIPKAICGHRLHPTGTRTRNSTDRLLAQAHSAWRQALGVPSIVPLTRRHFSPDPIAQRQAPLKEHGESIVATGSILAPIRWV